MTLCSKAAELVREIRATEDITSYEKNAIEDVVQEIYDLHSLTQHAMEVSDGRNDPYYAANILVHHHALLRNKRCVLAYLAARAERIKKARWELGRVLPDPLSSCMSARELQFFDEYNKCLTKYLDVMGLDLTVDSLPPQDVLIRILVKEDCGNLSTADGTIILRKHTTHYVRREDVEQLIRQGKVEVVN